MIDTIPEGKVLKVLRNPKKPEEIIKSYLDEDEVLSLLKKMVSSSFAQGLANQTYPWTLGQKFWAYKLAEENRPIDPISLESNLQEFISKAPLIQFRLEIEESEEKRSAKVFLETQENCILVRTGFRACGKIIGNQFFPFKACPLTIIASLIVMSRNPMEWIMAFGKATGRCCVCGLQLTNEESVARGIGPICAERWS